MQNYVAINEIKFESFRYQYKNSGGEQNVVSRNNTETTYTISVSDENVKIIAQLFNKLEKAQNHIPKLNMQNTRYVVIIV